MEAQQIVISKPWGKEILLTSDQLPYVGKLIHINTGSRLSLQYHEKKTETQCLVSGRVLLWLEDQDGQLTKTEMEPERGYTIPANRKHRLEALEDSVVFEVSAPEIGTTVRIEDDYGRPDETEDIRNSPNRGWSNG